MLPKEIKRYLEKHPQDVQELVDKWGTGKVRSIEANTEGWSNVSVQVRTETGDYFLRLVNELRRERAELEVEATVLVKLGHLGLPVVPSIAALNGDMVVEFEAWGERFWANLFEVASGSVVEVLNTPQVRAMGEEMARIDAVLDKHFGDLNFRNFDFTKELELLRKELGSQKDLIWPYHEVIPQTGFEGLWQERLDALGKNFEKHRQFFSKTNLIHGDFHQANLLFDGENVSAVLDFDNLICAPRIIDVSVCFYHLKYQHGRMVRTYKEVGELLLEGYQRIEELASEEKKVLPWITEFWLWTLVPQLHYYSDKLPGHHEYQAERLSTTLAGIRELQDLKFN